MAAEAGEWGHELVQRHGTQHWSELFRQAKDIGDVGIHACSLSMEMFGITKDDLDPLVGPLALYGVGGIGQDMAEIVGTLCPDRTRRECFRTSSSRCPADRNATVDLYNGIISRKPIRDYAPSALNPS